LPKGKENDELDAENLEKRFVLCQIHSGLNVKLYQAVHCDCHGDCVKRQDPNVCKRRTERRIAVSIGEFGDERNKRKEYSDEAVLEHANVDDLKSRQT
jgi:hypothetical protein